MSESSDRSASVEGWVAQSLPRALAYALSLTRDRHLAEDIVQDCFCRLLARRDSYDLPRDGFKILLRATTNACIDRQRRVVERTNVEMADECEPIRGDARQTHAPDPPEIAMSHELEAAIGGALEHLPWMQRAALELKSLGCSLAEVAAALRVSEGNAGVLVHRARQAMTQELGPFLKAD
jgi:RNA polymerase sigma-70 factor (ECF subfamily)